MSVRSITGWVIAACLVFGALMAFMPPCHAASATPAPPDRTLYADVKGRVVDDATGAPLPNIPVSLLYETVVTGPDGNFLFQKIPMIHTAQISLRVSTDEGIIIGCTTFDVPVRFYPISAQQDGKVDIKIIEPGVDLNTELRLKAVPLGKIDEYCSQCHLENPCVETATFRSVVASGKDLRGLIVKESQLEKFRDQLKQQGVARDSYSKIRYQDTHPDAMDMVFFQNIKDHRAKQFSDPPDLTLNVVKEKDEVKKFVVCDTCHTRHGPTGQRQFVVLPFEDPSDLCYQCHQ